MLRYLGFSVGQLLNSVWGALLRLPLTTNREEQTISTSCLRRLESEIVEIFEDPGSLLLHRWMSIEMELWTATSEVLSFGQTHCSLYTLPFLSLCLPVSLISFPWPLRSPSPSPHFARISAATMGLSFLSSLYPYCRWLTVTYPGSCASCVCIAKVS